MNESAVSVVVSVTRRRTRARIQATREPDQDAADRLTQELDADVEAVTEPPIATIAVRRMVIAVASLNSDSPSRIVTMRRGSPMRRATAVAATASGGATTAPRAIAADERDAHQPPGHEPDPGRGEDDQPDRQQPDDVLVRPEVDERGADRRRIQQGRQDAEEDQLRSDLHVRRHGHERDEDPDGGEDQGGRRRCSGGRARTPRSPPPRWPAGSARSAPADSVSRPRWRWSQVPGDGRGPTGGGTRTGGSRCRGRTGHRRPSVGCGGRPPIGRASRSRGSCSCRRVA